MLINFKLTYMSVVSLSSGEKRVFTGEITLHTKIKTIAVKIIMTTAKELMIILKNPVYLSELSSSTFLLPSIPYNTSRQANFWKSTLTQDWLSTFLSIVLRKFITKLHSHLPAQFPPALHKALSYLLFFLLGTVLHNKLNFNKNTDFIHKRCQPRIFCLQKLRALNVSAAFLCTFYRSCIESVLIFSFLCWFGGLNVKSKNVLNKVVNVCGKVMGERQGHLSQLYECRVVWKVIVDDNSHVPAKY